MPYNVVFEYDESMGGAYGNRYWTQYKDEQEFQKLFTVSTGVTIVAQDVSEDGALDLTSLTPEICRLMCAIEQAFEDNPNANWKMIDFRTSMAQYAIRHDRQWIKERSLTRYDATKYIEAFRKMAEDYLTKSKKHAAMKAMLTFLSDNFGRTFLP